MRVWRCRGECRGRREYLGRKTTGKTEAMVLHRAWSRGEKKGDGGETERGCCVKGAGVLRWSALGME